MKANCKSCGVEFEKKSHTHIFCTQLYKDEFNGKYNTVGKYRKFRMQEKLGIMVRWYGIFNQKDYNEYVETLEDAR